MGRRRRTLSPVRDAVYKIPHFRPFGTATEHQLVRLDIHSEREVWVCRIESRVAHPLPTPSIAGV